jgi:polar amino acid transport system substrate-binding protein
LDKAAFLRRIPKYYLLGGAIAALALLGSGVLFAKIEWAENKDNTWDRIEQSRALRIAMDASYPPFEDLDGAGNIIGFDVDLAHEIGRRLGLQIAITNIAYDGLADALVSGQVDMLLSALTAPPQLEGKARLSIPYFNAGDVLVTPAGSTIKAMADMEGHSLAVEYGSSGDVEARKWERRLSDLKILRYPLADAALTAVAAGEADATLTDGISARLAVGKDSRLALGANVTDSLFVAAMPKDSPALQEKIDDTLREMLSDGTVAQLIEKWFGHPAVSG